MVEQKRNFLKWLQKFLVCMFRLFYDIEYNEDGTIKEMKR